MVTNSAACLSFGQIARPLLSFLGSTSSLRNTAASLIVAAARFPVPSCPLSKRRQPSPPSVVWTWSRSVRARLHWTSRYMTNFGQKPMAIG